MSIRDDIAVWRIRKRIKRVMREAHRDAWQENPRGTAWFTIIAVCLSVALVVYAGQLAGFWLFGKAIH